MWKKFILSALMTCALSLSTAVGATDVRVAVVKDQVTVALTAAKDFTVVNLATGAAQTLPKGKYFAHVEQGQVFLEDKAYGAAIAIEAGENQQLPTVNGKNYDGTLQLKVSEDKLLATNTLELEQLLARVLPYKTMPIWPDEAIKAQAVAARTYVLYQKQHHGKGYDLLALDKEVPYYGLGQRTTKAPITKLVQATAGQYVADANGNPIFAVTTSSSGGETASGLEAYGKDYSYLTPVEDYDQDSPEYKWDFRISPEYVQGLLEQNGYTLGKLMNVRLSPDDDPGADRTETGRVRYMIFGGTLGVAKLTGQQVADLFNLNSNNFDVETGTPIPDKIELPITNTYGMEVGRKDVPIKVKEQEQQTDSEFLKSYHSFMGGKDEKLSFHGKGKGLGAGLSAWGARGLAGGSEKYNYEQILAHYYPGTYLVQ